MRSAVIAICLLVSGWANALTLSPMQIDKLVYTNFNQSAFRLENTSNGIMYYDVWIALDVNKLEPEDGFHVMGTVLGGRDYKSIQIPIMGIKQDKLEVYYVCAQEKPTAGEFSTVGRTCAKLRLYWPASELRKLQ